MKPYWENGIVQLYHGDASVLLPQVEAPVDSIITDPVWPNGTVFSEILDPAGLFAETAKHFSDLSRRVAVILGCDSDPRFLQGMPESMKFFRVASLELVRPGYKGRLMYTGDIAYLFGDPPQSRDGMRVIPGRVVDTSSNGQQSDHPTPRKLTHMQWLVKWWSHPGETVLDPFVGSGTTCIAAQRSGRKAIGIDINADYLDMAIKRIEAVPLPMQLGATT